MAAIGVGVVITIMGAPLMMITAAFRIKVITSNSVPVWFTEFIGPRQEDVMHHFHPA
jgi:hypothetical protein